MKQDHVIAYDIGTTGNKTCLYRLNGGVTLLAESTRGYPLHFTEGGGVEQDPADWWESMAVTTQAVLQAAELCADDVAAVSFCSQMQGLVLVDTGGSVLRPAMSYMDKRADAQFDAWRAGPLKVADVNVRKLLVSLRETGVVAASAKDPVFRYAWVKENEPDIYGSIFKWLDVKDYLVMKATGRFTMSEDSAYATLLYDAKRHRWSETVCRLHSVDASHMPEVVHCAEKVGGLTGEAAAHLGLGAGCPVFSGGGDSSLIGVGAGCTRVGETHVYMGTSGWVSTVADRTMVDAGAMMASIVGAIDGRYNYFAEMETAGKCVEWARDNLMLDELGGCGWPGHGDGDGDETVIGHMCDIASHVPPGSRGVVFMPWLLGNRCPFEDADCRGGFINISLTTKKEDLVRAVFEGVLMHIRWMLEKQDAKVKTSEVIRFAGGGARAPAVCQMLSDILNRPVERVENPQNAGALGAAVLMAAGLGHVASLDEARVLAKTDGCFTPNPGAASLYDNNYAVFRRLYRKNKTNFRIMNRPHS